MLKIIIPLAGSSELFSNAGYFYPKPLIEVRGTPMIEVVLQNPSLITEEKQFIFILKEDDARKFHLDNTLRILSPGCEIVKLKRDTKGGLCSVLMSIDKISPDDSLLILNGDQIIDHDFIELISFWINHNADAGLVTFRSVHPRWSYARIENDIVVQTAEKNPISDHAIAGVYYFKEAKEFFTASFTCICKDVQLDGLYYISPVINEYVLNDKKVVAQTIQPSQYHLFYSPQVLHEYERRSTAD